MDSNNDLVERIEHVETALKATVLQLETRLRRMTRLCFALAVILAVVAGTSIHLLKAQMKESAQQRKLLVEAQLEAQLAREMAVQKVGKRSAFDALFQSLDEAGMLKVFDGNQPKDVPRK